MYERRRRFLDQWVIVGWLGSKALNAGSFFFVRSRAREIYGACISFYEG